MSVSILITKSLGILKYFNLFFRDTFNVVLEKVIEVDYPEKWPNLVDLALEKMKSAKKTNDLYASLVVIENIISTFQFKISSERTPLEVMLKRIFPYLVNLAGTQLKNWSKDTTRILILILRCFYKAIYLEISGYFKDEELKFWMFLVKTVMDRDIDSSLVEKTTNWKEIIERQDSEPWKLKIICCQIICKMNYHIKKMDEKVKVIQEIKETYLIKYSRGFLESCFRMLKGSKTHYIAPKVLSYCIKSIGNAIENDVLFGDLQPNFEMILFDHIFPLLSLNGKDEEYWEEDPVQFIYSEEQAIDDHSEVKNSCKAIINLILKYKNFSKNVPMCLVMMEYLAFVFRDKKDVRSGKPLTPQMKEYLYRAFEMGSEVFLDHKDIVDKLEELIEFILIPDLRSEFDILKARACSVISKYGGLVLERKQNYIDICAGICKNLMHKHLCVRIKATQALNMILMHEGFRELLRPELPQILDSIVKTMNEVECEALINALEGITTEFSDSMGKYAVDLIKRLSISFKDYIKLYEEEQNKMGNEESDGEELTESKKAAEACLEAITNILSAKLDDDIYREVTPVILELLNMSLVAGDKYCSEKCFSFLNILLYKSSKLNDELLFYYPILVYFITGKPQGNPVRDIGQLPRIFQDIIKSSRVFGNRLDSFENMIGCFLNYIAKTGTQFLKSTDIYGIKFVDLLFEMIKKIGNECIRNNNYGDLCLSIRLLIGLIENLRGKIDFLMEKILDIGCDLIKQNKTDSLKSVLIQLICMMFWYDPTLAIELLDKKEYTKGVLEIWFKNVDIFSSDFEKERELYGIAGLISLPAKYYPKVNYSLIFLSFYTQKQSEWRF